ncbi:MAG: hypothetical protein ABI811_03610 [Acidobacteriota bacterium]
MAAYIAKPGAEPMREATGPRAKKILFVCIGNSCRSQMAEGFARKLAGNALEIRSAGLSPAGIVMPDTHDVMKEHGILLDGQFPKGIELMVREPFDVVINMSGELLPRMNGRVVEWKVRDPIGQNMTVYRTVADQIEVLVRDLVTAMTGESVT